MGDSDWLDYSINGTTAITNYSQSDCFPERAVILDAQAGWGFPLADWLTLEPYVALGFMDFKWTARDGYLQYPPGWLGGNPPTSPTLPRSTQPQVPISGVSVIYEQTYFIPAVGVAAKLRLGRSADGTVSFAFSPLVFCNDVDNHLQQSGSRDF